MQRGNHQAKTSVRRRRGMHEALPSFAKRMSPAARTFMVLVLCFVLPVAAFAEVTADISLGSVTVGDVNVSHTTTAGAVTEAHGGSVVVTQSDTSAPTSNTVSVSTSTSDVSVTLDNVNISASTGVSVDAGSGTTVTVELDGSNVINGNMGKSEADGALVITDSNNDGGSLEVGKSTSYSAAIGSAMGKDVSNITIEGGTIDAKSSYGAAIGAGQNGDASNITISGGDVTATSSYGAGIGGGQKGSGTDITVSDGTVNAKANYGAAIGGGQNGEGSGIEISGGDVTATGGYGAGIGGGQKAEGSDIEISGDAEVEAKGTFGAAIGGGQNAEGTDITITDSAVVEATNNGKGAAIGGGMLGVGSGIEISGDAQVSASSDLGAAIGGGSGGWADAGDGYAWHDGADGSDITISGNAQVDATSKDGAAIGGGSNGNVGYSSAKEGGIASNIVISENAQVTAENTNGTGNAIGAGGGKTTGGEGTAVTPDTSGLYDTGKVEDKNNDVVINGVIVNPDKPITSIFNVCVSLVKNYSIFDVVDFADKDIAFSEKVKDTTLYITVKDSEAEFSCAIDKLAKLVSDGIEKVVFDNGITEAEIVIADVQAAGGDKLVIIMDGEDVTLTIDGVEKPELIG